MEDRTNKEILKELKKSNSNQELIIRLLADIVKHNRRITSQV